MLFKNLFFRATALLLVIFVLLTPLLTVAAGPSAFLTSMVETAVSKSPNTNYGLARMQLGSDPVFVGAGDISTCTGNGDEATAKLLDGIDGTVFTTGDNVYPDGAYVDFLNCYDPTWGRHKARTFPSVGNHDYQTIGAAGYFSYFGAAAGDPTKGYYSYDLGAWHIIVLNSEIPANVGSPQEQWLRADLAAHPVGCTAAYWHRPRFSSGVEHGSDSSMQPLWLALYDYGADVVLNGHEHNYERFALQDPTGHADPVRGIREFVVGSGGASHYSLGSPIANSEVRNSNTYGVLKLTLHSTSYDWKFIPEAGKTFTDSGSTSCIGLETFLDVPDYYWAFDSIEPLYNTGITGGCSIVPRLFCPDSLVTRAQMAVLLERSIHGSSYTPPPVVGSTGFGDVPRTYWAAAWIKQLAADGITTGCGAGNYCPDYPVTRAQMAIFLLKSKYGSAYTPPAVGSSTGFKDVSTDYWAAAWITQLAAEGITGGCGTNVYCPESPVTRAQMAVFLVRTFNLP